MNIPFKNQVSMCSTIVWNNNVYFRHRILRNIDDVCRNTTLSKNTACLESYKRPYLTQTLLKILS